MATKITTNLLFLAMLSLSIFSSTAEEAEAIVGVIEGMVYCQSCKHFGTSCLNEATPIPSARVGIACKDNKNRVGFYNVYNTDPNGYFYAELPHNALQNIKGGGVQHMSSIVLNSCTVRLLSSPLPNCNLLSDINSGIVGAPLRHTGKSLAWVKDHSKPVFVYAAGPLAFRPSPCSPATNF